MDEQIGKRAVFDTSPLRIGFLVNHFPVLSETFISLMAKGLMEAGHELDIHPIWGVDDLTIAADQPVISDGGLASRVSDPGFPNGFGRRLLKTPRVLVSAVALHGTRTLQAMPPLNWSKRSLNMRLLYEAAMLRRRRYDVFHCQYSSLTPYALEWRRLGLLDAPIIGHLRGYDITQEVRNRGEEQTRKLFAEIDFMVAASGHFRHLALELGCSPERCRVIPSAIDLDRFPHRPPAEITDRPVRIAAVGRLVEKKGFSDALKALTDLRERGIDAVLDLVGDGPLMPVLRDRAEELGLSPSVTFHGALTSPKVAQILAGSDIFVAPSVTSSTGDQDGIANSIKEAMAVGLPVVTTRHGGIPELVVDGDTGFLVPEHAPELLAERMERLARDVDLRRRFSVAGRSEVEARFSPTATNQRIEETYREVTARYRSPDDRGGPQ